jgi:hypothetical protein
MEQEGQPTTTPIQKSVTDETKLVDIPVTNENMALNLLVSFINLAQRRGAFNIDESAKIYECIKKFQKPN